MELSVEVGLVPDLEVPVAGDLVLAWGPLALKIVHARPESTAVEAW